MLIFSWTVLKDTRKAKKMFHIQAASIQPEENQQLCMFEIVVRLWYVSPSLA